MSLHQRRAFLKRALLGGAVLPILPQNLFAQGSSGIKRLLIIYTPDGSRPQNWQPTAGSSGSVSDFALAQMTSPLAAFTSKSVYISGLNMYEGGLTHEGGVRKVLTGNSSNSIDHYLSTLDYFKQTKFSKLNLGIASGYQNGSGYMTFANGQMIAPIDSPVAAYNTLFSNLNVSTTTLSNDPDVSIIDRHLQDIMRLQVQLGSDEKAKLDLHLDSLREVERRFETTTNGVCTLDSAIEPGVNAIGEGGGYPPAEHKDSNFEAVTDMQMKIIRNAFACDLTRIATLQFSHPVSPNNFKAINGIASNTHDASHFGSSTTAINNFIAIKQWYTQKIASMLAMLDESGLLDDTIVLHVSELGDSNAHDHKNMPFALFGGKNLGMTQQAFLQFDNDAHTKMLVSIINALGGNVSTFGYDKHGTGGLSGLFS